MCNKNVDLNTDKTSPGGKGGETESYKSAKDVGSMWHNKRGIRNGGERQHIASSQTDHPIRLDLSLK